MTVAPAAGAGTPSARAPRLAMATSASASAVAARHWSPAAAPLIRRAICFSRPRTGGRSSEIDPAMGMQPFERSGNCLTSYILPALRRQLLKPGLKALRAARCKQRGPMPGLGTQHRHGKAGSCGDFAGMANIPALEPGRGRLEMALQGKSVAFPGEGLVLVAWRRGEQARAFRQIESVAMPMQHRRAVAEWRQAGSAPDLGELQRRPADLLARAGVDTRTQRARHELAAEADAEHRPAAGETMLDDAQLVHEEGVELLLIGADRPAQHDQEIRRRHLGSGEVVDRSIAIGDRPAATLEQRGEGAEILERDVADGDGAGHRTCA